MIEANLVRPQDVDGIWPLIAADVVKCLDKTPSYMTAGDLWVSCRSGAAYLFVAHDGADLKGAAIWKFDGDKFVCLMLVGRDMNKWAVQLHDAAAQTARMGGATRLLATGRTGLGTALKRHFPTLKIIRHTFEVEV